MNRPSRPVVDHRRCAAPDPYIAPPAFTVPAGAVDAHAHVVADDPTYPLVAQRSYTPPAATEAAYLAMLEACDMSRGVLVQISVYGTDNRHLLATLARHPQRLRGVAVVEPDISPAELQHMHALGVRALRLNVLFGGGVGLAAMTTLAEKIAPLGWHLELLMDVRQLPELMPRIERLPVPVVIDHMGHMPAALGIEAPGFTALRTLLREHGGWAKLSGAYRIDTGPDYEQAGELARALIADAPQRLVYGSDWPHVGRQTADMPNTGVLRDLLARWCPEPETRRAILVDNPARLYDFPDTPA